MFYTLGNLNHLYTIWSIHLYWGEPDWMVDLNSDRVVNNEFVIQIVFDM